MTNSQRWSKSDSSVNINQSCPSALKTMLMISSPFFILRIKDKAVSGSIRSSGLAADDGNILRRLRIPADITVCIRPCLSDRIAAAIYIRSVIAVCLDNIGKILKLNRLLKNQIHIINRGIVILIGKSMGIDKMAVRGSKRQRTFYSSPLQMPPWNRNNILPEHLPHHSR